MKKSFRTKLEAAEGVLLVRVPFDVKVVFGRARPSVVVSIGRYSFRTTIAVYGGEYFIGIRRSHREALGIEDGQSVFIAVALDVETAHGRSSA